GSGNPAPSAASQSADETAGAIANGGAGNQRHAQSPQKCPTSPASVADGCNRPARPTLLPDGSATPAPAALPAAMTARDWPTRRTACARCCSRLGVQILCGLQPQRIDDAEAAGQQHTENPGEVPH